MAEICESCGIETPRYVTKFFSGRAHHTCHVCEHPRHSAPCTNPYGNLVIEHVLTEENKPLRVTSKRQLLEAEKKYKFRSLVAHMNSENWDKPPQTPALTGADRILATMEDRRGQRDSHGNKLGFLFPDTARQMLKQIKDEKIDIATW
jgi:hypothetical protein